MGFWGDSVRLLSGSNVVGKFIIRNSVNNADIPGDAANGLDVDVTRVPLSQGAGATDATTLRVITASDGPLNTNLGTTTDAAIAAGATGSISAKLRSISRDLIANIVLAAGSNLIGKVGIDQTTPGTTNLVSAVGTKTNNSAAPTTQLGVLPAIANAVAPVLTEGYDVKQSVDLAGNQRTTLGTLLAGEDQNVNRMMTQPKYNYTHITTATTTAAIKTGAGVLHSITFGKRIAAGVTTIEDALTDTGANNILVITEGAAILSDPPAGGSPLDVAFATGLTIKTSQAEDIMVAWL